MEARHPETMYDIVGAQSEQYRPADRNVNFIGSVESETRIGRVIACLPPELMADEVDVHGILEWKSCNCAIGEEARSEQTNQKHRGDGDGVDHVAANVGFATGMLC